MDIVLIPLIQILIYALTLYTWVLIVAVLITWVNPDPYNPIVRFLRAVTDPVLYRVRRLMPFLVISGIDLSPIVVILAVQFLKMVLTNVAMAIAGM